MLCSYKKIDIENNKWATKRKDWGKVTALHKIAVDCVFHDLNSSFYRVADGTHTHIEEDVNYSYWSDNALYTTDELFRLYIDEYGYLVYNYLYITEDDKIILVAIEHNDIWADDDVVAEEIEELPNTYFLVEY